jgi:hypothetical protein
VVAGRNAVARAAALTGGVLKRAPIGGPLSLPPPDGGGVPVLVGVLKRAPIAGPLSLPPLDGGGVPAAVAPNLCAHAAGPGISLPPLLAAGRGGVE